MSTSVPAPVIKTEKKPVLVSSGEKQSVVVGTYNITSSKYEFVFYLFVLGRLIQYKLK
jgi:hypothetical protein